MREKFYDLIRKMIKEPVEITDDIKDIWWIVAEISTAVLNSRKEVIAKFYDENKTELNKQDNFDTKLEIESLLEKFEEKLNGRAI